ncbi:MAG: RluA family pseudouridine synthase [Acidobacteriota bacterium]|nr:MAG: RluA family pseudouridine synthase [Acidobacteriota bacterium]
MRLDRFCAARHPERSRSQLARLIREGLVLLDGAAARPSVPLSPGSVVTVTLPPPADERVHPAPLPLDVLYEDEHFLVINKPAGLVVHPGAGVRGPTLAAALLHRDARLAGVGGAGRCGLVHRLDRGTSVLLLVARHPAAHEKLAAQFRARRVDKLYHAIVWGRPGEAAGSIELPVGRDPRSRVKMSTRSARARRAESHYRVLEEVPGFALVAVKIVTGRTHQVRVHLSALGHPIVGDRTYAGDRTRSVLDPLKRKALRTLDRPALHARKLRFEHPATGASMSFIAPWPEQLTLVWRALGGAAP